MSKHNEHLWKCTNAGLYDSEFTCLNCGLKHTVSVDNRETALPKEGCLDKRMKDAGMMPVSEMLERGAPLGKFSAHAGVKDLETFEQWIKMRLKEHYTLQAKMVLDSETNQDLYEWVIAHTAVLGEVLANFRQATGREP